MRRMWRCVAVVLVGLGDAPRCAQARPLGLCSAFGRTRTGFVMAWRRRASRCGGRGARRRALSAPRGGQSHAACAGRASANACCAGLASANACFAGLASANACCAGLASANACCAGLASANACCAGLAVANACCAGLAVANVCCAGQGPPDRACDARRRAACDRDGGRDAEARNLCDRVQLSGAVAVARRAPLTGDARAGCAEGPSAHPRTAVCGAHARAD